MNELEENKKSKTLEISGQIFINWESNISNFTINNSDTKEKNRCKSEEKISNIIRINDELFLIITNSKKIEIWDIQGNQRTVFSNQLTDLFDINIIENYGKYYIFIVLHKESISLWNINGDQIYSIETTIDSAEKIYLSNEYFQILENDKLCFYDLYDGEQFFNFLGQNFFIEDFVILNTKNLIIKDINKNIKLYDDKGVLLKEFSEFKFSFNKLIETESNELIILANDNAIKIIDKLGNVKSNYKPKNEVIEHFDDFINGKVKLANLEKNKNKIEQYPHISNPYENSFIAKKIIKDNNINLENEEINYLWNFFNRPIFSEIKLLLNKEEKSTVRYKNIFNNSIDDINENISKLKSNIVDLESSAKTNLIISLVFIIITLGVGFAINPFGFFLILISGFTFTNYYNKNNEIKDKNNQINSLESEINTINVVSPQISRFIKEIKNFRHKLLQQIPFLSDNSLYSGVKAKQIIENKINTEIYQNALSYCGLIEDDITHVDKKAIILNDGSLLQEFTNRINKHNLNSFWQIKDGSVLFASQYIQFIFLTKEKIDIFSCHYDFILNKFISKEAQAFYYKDVTNISKKDVERELLSNKEKSLATEINLKVSSGDQMAFTIFSKETFEGLNEKNSEMDKLIEKLEQEYKEIEDSTDYENDEDKTNDLEFIKLQIKSLKQSSNLNETVKLSDNEINKTIQNIRKHVNQHKN
ncbi:hypothetical protein AAX27_00353 [Aliarcobacter thereius]|nr:hypothetical protein AAX27_00353 [Aliarcobacter thereius]